MTDEVIRWHLSGSDASGAPFVAGLYPLLLDEKCFLLAVAFDKAAWREDVSVFVDSSTRRVLAQHLADPVAYRRDRRKDRLLHENGYFVLRFLAEDVGKELDAVLDAILRALRRHTSDVITTPLRFAPRHTP